MCLPVKLQSSTKGCRQTPKLSRIGFSVECFIADFWRFHTKNVRISLRMARWVITIKSKHVEIFVKFSFYIVWELLRQLAHSLTGDKSSSEIEAKVKMPSNILSKIIGFPKTFTRSK